MRMYYLCQSFMCICVSMYVFVCMCACQDKTKENKRGYLFTVILSKFRFIQTQVYNDVCTSTRLMFT